MTMDKQKQTTRVAARIESALARGILNLPAGLLRTLAGRPVVRDSQTLDVQTQMLLRLQTVRGNAALGGRSVARERALMDAQAQLLEPRASRRVSTRDIQVAGGDGPCPARVYRPEGVKSDGGALVFYHGGGFVIGSLDTHDGVCRAIADRAQCVVIAIDYRLAPEHPAPAGVEDGVAAFRDIVGRAAEFQIDPDRVAVSGDSAGGNLSAVVCQTTRNDAHSPCFQLLFYPAVDFVDERESVRTFAKGFLLEKTSMDWFRGHYLSGGLEPGDTRVSPMHGDLQGLPPALVITGGFDPLRDEGEAYAEALKAAGGQANVVRYPSMIHGFLNFAGAVAGADAALTDGAHALRDALGS
ncbi:alpha/beta hydrolase [uncultured Salinisphaera sp.]|uniref:alpha/beta hydrolase n=1 Tax=uncultured Salinisphaera sp. TaxID=359372 RepID=UPI0032B16919